MITPLGQGSCFLRKFKLRYLSSLRPALLSLRMELAGSSYLHSRLCRAFRVFDSSIGMMKRHGQRNIDVKHQSIFARRFDTSTLDTEGRLECERIS